MVSTGAGRAPLPWLPIRGGAYMRSLSWGHVAEWLRNGLQNRVHQFNSGRGLHYFNDLAAALSEIATGLPPTG
jgi:hypothetical protein